MLRGLLAHHQGVQLHKIQEFCKLKHYNVHLFGLIRNSYIKMHGEINVEIR